MAGTWLARPIRIKKSLSRSGWSIERLKALLTIFAPLRIFIASSWQAAPGQQSLGWLRSLRNFSKEGTSYKSRYLLESTSFSWGYWLTPPLSPSSSLSSSSLAGIHGGIYAVFLSKKTENSRFISSQGNAPNKAHTFYALSYERNKGQHRALRWVSQVGLSLVSLYDDNRSLD